MNKGGNGGDTSRDRESFAESRAEGAVRPGHDAKPTPSWDPYQVWLTRVKEPRDRHSRSHSRDGHLPTSSTSPDISDTARMRALAPIGPVDRQNLLRADGLTARLDVLAAALDDAAAVLEFRKS